jgi:hypothetical protein
MLELSFWNMGPMMLLRRTAVAAREGRCSCKSWLFVLQIKLQPLALLQAIVASSKEGHRCCVASAVQMRVIFFSKAGH